MSEEMLFKPQQEWLDHFGELAKEHGEMLAQPFVEFFADKILLTKKEIEEARDGDYKYICLRPLSYKDTFGCAIKQSLSPFCRLCKKLTQFAKGGEDE